MASATKSNKLAVAVVSPLVVAGVIWFALLPSPKLIVLEWDKNDVHPETVSEVWSSTNLRTWQFLVSVSGNNVTLPASKPAEFFIVRNRRGTNVSDWARKP